MSRNYYYVRSRLLDGGSYTVGELASMTNSTMSEVRQSIDDLRRQGYKVKNDGRYFWIDGILDPPENIDGVIKKCINIIRK